MKKAVIILASMIGIGVIFSISPLLNYICAFLFAGIIPGTGYVLPFWAMSLILGYIGVVAINWLMKQSLFIGDDPYTQTRARERARASVKVARIKASPSLASTRHTRKRYQPAPSVVSN